MRETPPPVEYSGGTSPVMRSTVQRWGSSRPLPPLHARAALSSSPRSMELVLPVYRGESATSNMESEKSLDYGRRIVEGNTSSAGGLKKLFNFKELQMSPATS
jgi:hypothetical protein